MPGFENELSGLLDESGELAQEYREASQASQFERGLIDEQGALTEAGEAQQQAMAIEFLDSFPESGDPEEVRALGEQVLKYF